MLPDARGVRSGQLDQTQAAALAKDVGWDRLAALAGPDQSCPDAGEDVIRSADQIVRCSCGCDTPEKEALFAKLDTLKQNLWQSGIETDLGLTAWHDPNAGGTGDPAAWPLAWPIADIADINTSSGTPIASVSDRAALRTLRADYAATHQYFVSIVVQVGATLHGLMLRDNLPATTADQIAAFHAKK